MRSRGWSPERGMVTAELAVGVLAVVLVTVMLAWSLHLVTRQLLLEDTAAEVARQAARGDVAAVAEARKDAPPRTQVDIRREGTTIVVRARTDTVGVAALPSVELRAEARTIVEPGETWSPG